MSTQHPVRAAELTADCANCFALCCVGPAFAASADFAIDKPAGTPCPNLAGDFRCTIHADLRPRGFRGCTVYDCFGAGQKVSQVTFGGRDWRGHPEIAVAMFASLGVVRQLHELLWYLGEALDLPAARPLRAALRAALDETRGLSLGTGAELAALDVNGHRAKVNELLLRASELARADHAHRPARDHRGADLMGQDLRRADLRGASLRGALLIGADLRDADLRGADVIGVDFRGADLRGADLRDCIFLVQSQLQSARGDASTRLPASLRRPGPWDSTAR